nr:PH domain-containing protein [Halorhodospira abdelmalekii]
MLDPGEEVVYQAQVHWGVFLPTIGVITVILLLTLAPLGTIGYGVATVLYLIVLPGTAAHALSIFFNTELEVTQNQMAAATGLIVRTFRVLDRDDIQAVGVYQGWLGKLFGYGRMSFICRDGFGFKVPGIVDPEGVRKILSTR